MIFFTEKKCKATINPRQIWVYLIINDRMFKINPWLKGDFIVLYSWQDSNLCSPFHKAGWISYKFLSKSHSDFASHISLYHFLYEH